MIRISIIAAFALSAAACSGPVGSESNPMNWLQQPNDPEVMVYVFEKCMKSASGPQVTRYNDWDEAIQECRLTAASASAYCPKEKVCTPSSVTLEQVRAILPKEPAK